MSGAWQGSWHEALTAAELDLDETEAMLARLHADAEAVPALPKPWTPPADLGPLPGDQVDRARSLLARHHRLAVELASAMTSNRQHRRITDSVAQRSDARPVYVDTAV